MKAFPSGFWNVFQDTYLNEVLNQELEGLISFQEEELAFGNFSLNTFFSRYLCGGGALTSCRGVNRVRLLLAQLNPDTDDYQARLLLSSISNYAQACQEIAQADSLTKPILLNTHQFFGNDRSAFRASQNWVGESLEKATYLPPSPVEMETQLDLLYGFCDLNLVSDKRKILVLYIWLMAIHPFQDGNGRVARAVYEGLLSNFEKHSVHIGLYRLATQRQQFNEALWAFGVNSNVWVKHDYWKQALIWTKNFRKVAFDELSKSHNVINGKLALRQISEVEKTILEDVWEYPVFDVSRIQKKKIFNSQEVLAAVNNLISAGVVEPFTVPGKLRKQVFVCKDILETWNMLDEKVFMSEML